MDPAKDEAGALDVRRAVSTFVNHRHNAETYDDSEGAVLGRIHIERSFQGDLEGEATAELLTATAETFARSRERRSRFICSW